MADYWVSTKKYWCEYCGIFITDNKASRTHHETSARHKTAVQQYIRAVEKKKKEAAKEDEATRKMLEKIEQEAARKYEKDLGTTSGFGSSTSTSGKVEKEKTNAKAKDLWKNYGYGAAGGYAESTTNVLPMNTEEMPTFGADTPQEEGHDTLPGKWEVVKIISNDVGAQQTDTGTVATTIIQAQPKSREKIPENVTKGAKARGTTSIEIEEEEDEDADNLRTFQITEKVVASIDEDEEEPTTNVGFKKRKLGGKGKQRNTRARIE